MSTAVDLIAAFTIGLGGSTHCVAMCGGIAGALGLGTQTEGARLPLLLSFHLGRLLSYATIGLALGGLVALGSLQLSAVVPVLRLVAGLLLVAMGLYIAGWWSGLARLEALGGPIWARLQPRVRQLLPVRSPGRGLLLGSLWGWLPCGLVYSALTWSVSAGSGAQAGLRMFFFGLGTLPAMLTLSLAAEAVRRTLQRPGTRRTAGLLLLLYGLWTLATPLQELLQSAPSHHHHH